jgi:hypothetical protein
VLNPGDPEIIEAVDAHIARHVAPVETVFHEIISPDVHIDVHFVRAAPDRPFQKDRPRASARRKFLGLF